VFDGQYKTHLGHAQLLVCSYDGRLGNLDCSNPMLSDVRAYNVKLMELFFDFVIMVIKK
jgi:hypothetical protein